MNKIIQTIINCIIYVINHISSCRFILSGGSMCGGEIFSCKGDTD